MDVLLDKKRTIVDLHLSRVYASATEMLDVDALLMRYQLFPNEALYLVDCAQAQIEPLSSTFSKIIGIDRPHKNDLALLFDHCSTSAVEALYQWVIITLNAVFDKAQGFLSERDVFKCLYKTPDNRVILKCTTPLVYDKNGNMRYSLGKLIDLTGLIAFQHFGCKYEGPNCEKMYTNYKNEVQLVSPLTSREAEILEMIGAGLHSVEIGKKLFISSHTVDTHRRNIIQKLEVKTAFEAFCRSKNLGWL